MSQIVEKLRISFQILQCCMCNPNVKQSSTIRLIHRFFQICDQKMPCGHICPQPCHDQVLVKIEAKKAATPWEAQGPSTEVKTLGLF